MVKKKKAKLSIEVDIEEVPWHLEKEKETTPTQSVSLLLGAGFSAPIGYPIGNKLNELLLDCTEEDFTFHSDGTLVSLDKEKSTHWIKGSDDFAFDFCRDLMSLFTKRNSRFDYEEFYDFFKYEAENDSEEQELFESSSYYRWNSLGQILGPMYRIYSQLVAHFLVDGCGKSWYDDEGHMCGPIWPGYTGILDCLKKLGEANVVHVHTLNHDLFFERLSRSDWIDGLSDGFTELGSPFYGNLNINGRIYRCRLEHHVGNYQNRFRLYKLHGSKDYGLYKGLEGSMEVPERYIKTRFGIGFGEFLKEIPAEESEKKYEHCVSNYHADFLTGTTSKIERYEEPFLFRKLFKLFRNNLNEANSLVIVGYGAKDTEINKMLLENFDYENKPAYIIDLFPGDAVKKLREQLNAKLIKKELERISFEDLDLQ